MQGHFWHLFLAQFFMLFHMVALVLLSMVAFLTIFLLAENLQQPIRVFEIGGYRSCHGEQNESYYVKEDKNLYQKMVSKVTLHFIWGHLSRKQTVYSLLKPSRGSQKYHLLYQPSSKNKTIHMEGKDEMKTEHSWEQSTETFQLKEQIPRLFRLIQL